MVQNDQILVKILSILAFFFFWQYNIWPFKHNFSLYPRILIIAKSLDARCFSSITVFTKTKLLLSLIKNSYDSYCQKYISKFKN